MGALRALHRLQRGDCSAGVVTGMCGQMSAVQGVVTRKDILKFMLDKSGFEEDVAAGFSPDSPSRRSDVSPKSPPYGPWMSPGPDIQSGEDSDGYYSLLLGRGRPLRFGHRPLLRSASGHELTSTSNRALHRTLTGDWSAGTVVARKRSSSGSFSRSKTVDSFGMRRFEQV